MMKRLTLKLLLLIISLFGGALPSFSICPDLLINDITFLGDLSNSGQSFTATSTGKWTQLDLKFSQVSTGTLNVYMGNTVDGTPIHTQPFSVDAGEQGIILLDSIDIVEGQQYSIYVNVTCAYYPFATYEGGNSFTSKLAFPGDLWMRVVMEKKDPVFVTDTIISCGAYTWRNGATYDIDNKTAKDTLIDCNGDTIFSLDLHVINIEEKDLNTVNICSGDNGAVEIESSEIGVAYSLRNNADNTIIGDLAFGNGGTLSLPTGALTENKTYNVYAKKGTLETTALNFDGVDDRVYLNTNGEVISGKYTVEAWVKPNSITGSMTILSTRLNNYFAFDFKLQNGNNIHGDIGKNSGWITTTADAAFNYVAGKWYHFAYVVTETGYTIYANGLAVGSGIYSATPILTDVFRPIIIGGYNATGESFNGQIDEVRVWNIERSAQEIEDYYMTAIDASQTGLVAYYDFNNGTGSATLSDLTPNNYSGTLDKFDTNASWVTDPINDQTCYAQLPNTVSVSVTTVDTAIIHVGETLTANATPATYKWLDCADKSLIGSEADQSFTAIMNGEYAAEITQNSCVDTSRCIPITTVVTGVEGNNFGTSFTVYPNPFYNEFSVELETIQSEATVNLYSLTGELLISTIVTGTDQIQLPSEQAPGVYMLEVLDASNSQTMRVVKGE